MDLQVEETGPVERRLRVEVSTAEVDAAFEVVYRQLGSKARLRGFRPGKAPRTVLQRVFGDQARAETMERLVRETLPKAIEQAELALVSDPRLAPEAEPKEGAPFIYEANVEIRPSIELKTVRGLEVTRPTLPEPEQDPLERYVEELRASQAQLIEEAEGVQAARGHVVRLDYEATVEGEPFDGSQGRGQQLELGSGSAIPGFEEQVEGMTVGAERDFEIELPASFPRQELAGKLARFHLTLHELKRKELPELDDEFAKDVSEFDTLDALRADASQRIEEGRQRQQTQAEREAVIEALVQANPFPVPPSLVDRELDGQIARVLAPMRSLPPEQLEPQIQSLRERWRPQAERGVRLALLVPEIAREESIEVADADVDARVAEIAKERNEPVRKVRRSLAEQGVLDALRAGLLEERVVEFATAQATLSDA